MSAGYITLEQGRGYLYQRGMRNTRARDGSAPSRSQAQTVLVADKLECYRLGLGKIAVGIVLALNHPSLTALPDSYRALLNSYGIHTWIAYTLIAAGAFKIISVSFLRTLRWRLASSVVGTFIMTWLCGISLITSFRFPDNFYSPMWVLWIWVCANAWTNFAQRLSDVLAESRLRRTSA